MNFLSGYHLRRADNDPLVARKLYFLDILPRRLRLKGPNRFINLHAPIQLLVALLLLTRSNDWSLRIDIQEGVDLSHIVMSHILERSAWDLLSHSWDYRLNVHICMVWVCITCQHVRVVRKFALNQRLLSFHGRRRSLFDECKFLVHFN